MKYRDLLKRHIRHVGYNEGISFLEAGYLYADDGFTAEEIAELRALDTEVLRENKESNKHDPR